MTVDYISKASDICNRIYRAHDGAIRVDRGNPVWFDQASSKIALIAGGNDVLYVDHSIGRTGEGVGTIVAFTQDVLIVIEIDESVSKLEAPTRIISRRDLRALEIDTVTNAIGHSGKQYPNRIGATLTYSADKFALPYVHADLQLCAEFAALLPSLAADVGQPTL
ncbi:hypothetical protein C5C56_16125 [Rathayibacter sp. AY1D1]|uniref:hypothetical protein n=1 Tax=Rathayibacter sp. AY1D1 TaxID=2080542 RepID=UPI000CE7FFCC|nr:hypothetical protein [Rathayibacter sp. AY1D1]PPH95696.1 hypothetical protein C5C56_16125 [Rathayibacter sp. AY1D1]